MFVSFCLVSLLFGLLGWSGTHRNIRYEVESFPLVRYFRSSLRLQKCNKGVGAGRVVGPAPT